MSADTDAVSTSQSSGHSDQYCIICRTDFDEASVKGKRIKATAKGLTTLMRFSEMRGDAQLRDLLLCQPTEVYYHYECQKEYTNERLFQQQKRRNDAAVADVVSSKSLRSSVSLFEWKEHCFFCGQSAIFDDRHPERSDTWCVRTVEMREKVLAKCRDRNDQWALQVSGRLETCIDLAAADAIYHRHCFRSFYAGRSADAVGKTGKSTDEEKLRAFEKVCDWLEATCELCTISELHDIMQELAGPTVDVYSVKHMQRLILDKYKNEVVLASVSGRNNVVCFKNTASKILNDKWYNDRKESVEDDSVRVVTAAAKLIKGQIREALYTTDSYPLTSSFSDVVAAKQWLPSLLRVFLEIVVPSQMKQATVGHSVVQASRPCSVLPPVLFGIGVSLDHSYGSRALLDMLSRFGFCLTYDEVNRYKQSAVQCSDHELSLASLDAFTQWSADNVDHNVNTLDGTGSFHGMGIVSMSTARSRTISAHFSEISVPRLQRVNVAAIVKNRGIPIMTYISSGKSALSSLIFKPLEEVKFTYEPDVSVSPLYDLVWHASWWFLDCEHPRPNWSGYMQHVSKPFRECPPAADIRMLPIMDMNPNDINCIFSTLYFLEKQASLLNFNCVTFDQPLWLKAIEVVQATGLNVVCRLGSFHVVMSFLGSIGTIMAGSGLDDALKSCFGPVTVKHMLTGKAESRAVRGHFLVDAALHWFEFKVTIITAC